MRKPTSQITGRGHWSVCATDLEQRLHVVSSVLCLGLLGLLFPLPRARHMVHEMCLIHSSGVMEKVCSPRTLAHLTVEKVHGCPKVTQLRR